jgi:hypothetical protein
MTFLVPYITIVEKSFGIKCKELAVVYQRILRKTTVLLRQIRLFRDMQLIKTNVDWK